MEGTQTRHYVVDAGGIIKGLHLADLALNMTDTTTGTLPGKLYTVPEVVKEVKDKHAIAALSALPVELELREPSDEAMGAVTEFARKTGDFRSLSLTDLRVMALAYLLEKEVRGGTSHLRKEPARNIRVRGGAGGNALYAKPQAPKQKEKQPHPQQPQPAPQRISYSQPAGATMGFAAPSTTKQTQPARSWTSVVAAPDVDATVEMPATLASSSSLPSTPTSTMPNADASATGLAAPAPVPQQSAAAAPSGLTVHTGVDVEADTSASNPTLTLPADAGAGAATDGDSDEEEAGTWITQQNIGSLPRGSTGNTGADVAAGAGAMRVACVTTDYAMQNVLIQMGLTVVSVQGMLIKKTTQWGLKCEACHKTTMQMDKLFCPHCGNQSLFKISIAISKNGTVHVHDQAHSARRKGQARPQTRGTQFSLPIPKGGREGKAAQPVLAEDQLPGGLVDASGFHYGYRDGGGKQKSFNPMDRDAGSHFESGASAAGGGGGGGRWIGPHGKPLNVRPKGGRNPNEVRQRHGRNRHKK